MVVMKNVFRKMDVQYPENLHKIQNDLSFLGCKLKKLIKNLVNLYGKKEYVIQSRNLKHLLNHGTVLKKVHSVTKFNQKY